MFRLALKKAASPGVFVLLLVRVARIPMIFAERNERKCPIKCTPRNESLCARGVCIFLCQFVPSQIEIYSYVVFRFQEANICIYIYIFISTYTITHIYL